MPRPIAPCTALLKKEKKAGNRLSSFPLVCQNLFDYVAVSIEQIPIPAVGILYLEEGRRQLGPFGIREGSCAANLSVEDENISYSSVNRREADPKEILGGLFVLL